MQQYQSNNTWDMRVCSMFKCLDETLPTSNACKGFYTIQGIMTQYLKCKTQRGRFKVQ